MHNDLIEIVGLDADSSHLVSNSNLQIHGTGLFFPWHRHHLRTLENAMRTHCGYTGVMSYWDWTQGLDFTYVPRTIL